MEGIMAIRVSNMNELAVALKPTMLGMVDEMTERVYQTLNYFLQEYYDSYDPKCYRRQCDFLRSAVKVGPKVFFFKRIKVSCVITFKWTRLVIFESIIGYK
jgi:hypothetical protein